MPAARNWPRPCSRRKPVTSRTVDQRTGASVFFKCETLQRGGADTPGPILANLILTGAGAGTGELLLQSRERDDLAAGARGYCPKSAGHHTLLAALRLVMEGEVYVPPLMLAATAGAAAAPQAAGGAGLPGLPNTAPRLTERQLDVLRLLCEGRPNKDISRQLDLSEKTTKAHVTAIFKVLGVVNRTQAVLAARAAGLVRDGG